MIFTIAKFAVPLIVLISIVAYIRHKAGWKQHLAESFSDPNRDRSAEIGDARSRIKWYWVFGIVFGVLLLLLLLQRDSALVAIVTSVAFAVSYISFNARAWNRFIEKGDLQSYQNRPLAGHYHRNAIMIPIFLTIAVWIIVKLVFAL